MPYDLAIPGQMSERELKAIEQIAACVPEGGTVVEIGSLFGRSSWAWSRSVPASATVYCIDPWEGNSGVRPLEQAHGITYGLECFRHYLKDCPNVVPLKGYSPVDCADWSTKLDVFFDDAVHNDPVFSQNLEFWSTWVRPVGILCGHDYRRKFPDIERAVGRAARQTKRALIVVENIWCLLPRRKTAAMKRVQRNLRALAREWVEIVECHGREFDVDPSPMIQEPGSPAKLRGRVRSTVQGGLPLDNGTDNPVRVGGRVFAAAPPGRHLHELRQALPGERLGEKFVEFQLSLPALDPGSYRIELDLVREMVCWFSDCGQDLVTVPLEVPEVAN